MRPWLPFEVNALSWARCASAVGDPELRARGEMLESVTLAHHADPTRTRYLEIIAAVGLVRERCLELGIIPSRPRQNAEAH